MTADDLLTANALESPGLWVALLPLCPDQVVVRPSPRWMRRVLSPGLAAITLGKTVYVDPEVLDRSTDNAISRLLVHELAHARQWEQHGHLRFLYLYLREYLEGRLRGLGHHRAYHAISFEEAARAVELSVR